MKVGYVPVAPRGPKKSSNCAPGDILCPIEIQNYEYYVPTRARNGTEESRAHWIF